MFECTRNALNDRKNHTQTSTTQYTVPSRKSLYSQRVESVVLSVFSGIGATVGVLVGFSVLTPALGPILGPIMAFTVGLTIGGIAGLFVGGLVFRTSLAAATLAVNLIDRFDSFVANKVLSKGGYLDQAKGLFSRARNAINFTGKKNKAEFKPEAISNAPPQISFPIASAKKKNDYPNTIDMAKGGTGYNIPFPPPPRFLVEAPNFANGGKSYNPKLSMTSPQSQDTAPAVNPREGRSNIP